MVCYHIQLKLFISQNCPFLGGKKNSSLGNPFAPFMQWGANTSLQKCDTSGDDAERKEANSFLLSLKRRSLTVTIIKIKANSWGRTKKKEKTLKSLWGAILCSVAVYLQPSCSSLYHQQLVLGKGWADAALTSDLQLLLLPLPYVI